MSAVAISTPGPQRRRPTSRPELVLAVSCPRSRQQRWLLSLMRSAIGRRLPGVSVRLAVVERGFPRMAEVMYAASAPSVVVPVWLFNSPVLADILAASVLLSQAPVTVTPALGPDPLLAEAMTQRLRAAGAHPRDTLVLTAPVEPGSESHDDVCRAARMISARWGGRPVHVGVGVDPHSALPALLASVQRPGTRVALAPYALMPGAWTGRCESLAEACDVAAFGDTLVHHPLAAELVARRYEKATVAASSAA